MLKYKEVEDFVQRKGPVTARTRDNKEFILCQDREWSNAIIEHEGADWFTFEGECLSKYEFEQLVRGEGRFYVREIKAAWEKYKNNSTPITVKDYKTGEIIREFKNKTGERPEVIEVNRAEWEKDSVWRRVFEGAEPGALQR